MSTKRKTVNGKNRYPIIENARGVFISNILGTATHQKIIRPESNAHIIPGFTPNVFHTL
ncbi:MAG: hypothetical protein FWF87_04155 [Synergistaceae bacterium]|nr:hypothetical protein [Synergistaceae bacterium]